MEWILDIFSAKSDQARLITILLSTIVAVAIVLYTQARIDRREQKKHLNEKIEELFTTSITMRRSRSDYAALFSQLLRHKEFDSKSEYDAQRALVVEVQSSKDIQEIKTLQYDSDSKFIMLLELYFPKICFDKTLLFFDVYAIAVDYYSEKTNVIGCEQDLLAVDTFNAAISVKYVELHKQLKDIESDVLRFYTPNRKELTIKKIWQKVTQTSS